MGLEKIGYVTASALIGFGFLGFVYAVIRKQRRAAVATLAVGLIGVAVLASWAWFIAGLKQTLIEAIDDGQHQTSFYDSRARLAWVRGEPTPKPTEIDAEKIKAMVDAKRTMRLFGWDWKELVRAQHEARDAETREQEELAKKMLSR